MSPATTDTHCTRDSNGMTPLAQKNIVGTKHTS
jgi:hypothetical protein